MTYLSNDLTGRKFGRLKVLRRSHRRNKKNVSWLCLCDCGKKTFGITGNLKSGRHKSCGCYRKGDTSYRYKEKTIVNGYIFVINRSHPRANKYTGRVREHILIMENKIGRKLLAGEEVHHKNNIRSDNRPSNLELWVRSHPSGARAKDLIIWAKKILKTYQNLI